MAFRNRAKKWQYLTEKSIAQVHFRTKYGIIRERTGTDGDGDMSFRTNEYNQITLDDRTLSLTERESRMLETSWAEGFNNIIFSKINEEPFRVLYPGKDNSRPNTPVNVKIGALMLKEMFGLTDEELEASLIFDVRFQYALNTTSFQEQPLSLRSISRFRASILRYYMETGEDLLENEMKRLAKDFAQFMSIEPTLKRMDSLMISTNARIMGRLELIYTCTEMLVRLVKRLGGEEFITPDLALYLDGSNHNAVCYHAKDVKSQSRMEQALADAAQAFSLCGDEYSEFDEYQNMKRLLEEQAKIVDGQYVLKENDELCAKNMQTPHDPDATYRKKAGKKYVGYVGNVVEDVGENGAIITGFDLQPNDYSDVDFAKDIIKEMGYQDERTTCAVDGAYASDETILLAEQNNIELIPSGLVGSETDEIILEFGIDAETKKVNNCPIGQEPIAQKYNEATEEYVCHFDRKTCEECPNRNRCQAVIQKKAAKVVVSNKKIRRAGLQQKLSSGALAEIAAFRNGVEGVPSVLRRRYDVDNMPAFGLPRLKMWFSLKIGAINVKRVLAYARNLGNTPTCNTVFQKIHQFFMNTHLDFRFDFYCIQFLH